MMWSVDQTVVPPTGFIDLHSHVVPEVDDGAGSVTEALEMLRVAESDGIETILATPHLFSTHNLPALTGVEEIVKRRDSFIERVKKSALRIRVLHGAEIYFTTDLRSYLREYQCLITLNGSSYFILEFPYDFIFPNVKDFIYKVQMDGRIPIIAHPERNHAIQRNPRILYELVQRGALSQVNAGSFRGDFGEVEMAIAYRLLHLNLVHVISSDAHSAKGRPPRLAYVYSFLRDLEVEKIDLMVGEIPRAIIADKGIPDIGDPIDPKKKRKIFDFIKGKSG